MPHVVVPMPSAQRKFNPIYPHPMWADTFPSAERPKHHKVTPMTVQLPCTKQWSQLLMDGKLTCTTHIREKLVTTPERKRLEDRCRARPLKSKSNHSNSNTFDNCQPLS
jgi:hypothetical protein